MGTILKIINSDFSENGIEPNVVNPTTIISNAFIYEVNNTIYGHDLIDINIGVYLVKAGDVINISLSRNGVPSGTPPTFNNVSLGFSTQVRNSTGQSMSDLTHINVTPIGALISPYTYTFKATANGALYIEYYSSTDTVSCVKV